MKELTEYKIKKQPIIDAMRHELANTPDEEKYFTEKNITDCASDLDEYIDKLETAVNSEKKDKEITKAVKWVYKCLSTFKNGYEELEYLHGFIHNGYTKELTTFILDAAFTAGWKKGKPKSVKIDYCRFEWDSTKYSDSETYIGFSMVMGNDKAWVSFPYNLNTCKFEYNANPYGDSYGMPILNVDIAEDYNTLSFDVLSHGGYKTFKLIAQHESDQYYIRIFEMLNGNKVFNEKQIEPIHCTIKLAFENGKIFDLNVMAHNEEGHVRPGTEGYSPTLFMGNFDENGKFIPTNSSGEPQPGTTPKLTLLDYGNEKNKQLEVTSYNFNGNELVVETKEGTRTYPLFTIPFIRNILTDLLKIK